MKTAAEGGFRFRPNLWFTVFTVVVLAVLAGLGTWQLQRLEWKRGLTVQRAAALAAPPLSIGRVPSDWKTAEFRRVRATGRFVHGREMRVSPRIHRGRAGHHVITPLRLDGGGIVLVDRGWVPLDRADPARRLEGQVRGRVAVEGILRAGGRSNRWVPDNDPEMGAWHYMDVSAMAAAAGLGAVKPFAIEAGAAPNPGGLPVGGRTRTGYVNNHLQYAITWYALAASLIGVYIAFHLRRRG